MNSSYKNKPPFKYYADIQQICKPLFSQSKIDFLEFIRTTTDGSYLTFSSNPKWLQHYFEQEHYKTTYFHQHPKSYKDDIIMTATVSSGCEIAIDAANNFDINNAIALPIINNNYCDFFLMASNDKDQSIFNYYINNLDILKKFIYFFYDKADDLISLHMKDKFKFNFTRSVANENYILEQDQFSIKRYMINGDKTKTLSKRELECIYWIANGKSSQEIGIILNISARTVESHIQRVKKKLNCYKISRIVYLCKDHSLI